MHGPALIATIGAYPEYTDDTPPTGIVLVTAEAGGQLHVSASLDGLEPNSTGGVHIHVGMTCDNASLVGGHYWTPTTDPDPWATVVWTSDEDGAATAEFTVLTGYPLDSNFEHAVVVHAANGTRIGCGVLVSTSNSPTAAPTTSPTAPTAAPTDTPTSAPTTAVPTATWIGPVLMATMGTYPGYTGTTPLGTVVVSDVSGGQLRLSASLQSLPRNMISGIHIHAGTTCANASLVGGHYWTPLTDPNPWTNVRWASNSLGAATVYTTVDTGYPLALNYGHAVVVHGQSGTPISCGILLPATAPPSVAPTASPTEAPTIFDPYGESAASSDGGSKVNLWLAVGLPVLLIAAIVSAAIMFGGEIYLRRKYPQRVQMHPAYNSNPTYDTSMGIQLNSNRLDPVESTTDSSTSVAYATTGADEA